MEKTAYESATELPENSEPAPAPAERESIPEQPAETENPWSIEAQRLDQDFDNSLAVRKVITTIPCHKPKKQEWVRKRPGKDWWTETRLFEDEISRETYQVLRPLWPEVPDAKPITLFTGMARRGGLFIWPCKMPGPDGRTNDWHSSMFEAAELAETEWVQIRADMAAGHYEVTTAISQLEEPKWPEDLTFEKMLDICFRHRRIDTYDHPVLKHLRAES